VDNIPRRYLGQLILSSFTSKPFGYAFNIDETSRSRNYGRKKLNNKCYLYYCFDFAMLRC
jgi:hypothetical protein